MIEIAFLIVSLLSLVLIYFGTCIDKRLLLYFVVWQIAVGTIAALNIFKDYPKLFPIAIFGTVILAIILFRRIDKRSVNTSILLLIHILRIPVELLLYQLYLQQKIPLLMTYKGWNFDILIGLSALIILILLKVSSVKLTSIVFKIWNIIGIFFLTAIVILAILSAPLPIQQLAFDQPNIALIEFPYCFLPSCIVPIVFITHFCLLGKQTS